MSTQYGGGGTFTLAATGSYEELSTDMAAAMPVLGSLPRLREHTTWSKAAT